MTTDIQLPKVTQARMAKLAQVAGRSPAAMLRFVLRDGFDAVEQSMRENAMADVQFGSGLTHAHEDVMADAKKLLREARRGAHYAA